MAVISLSLPAVATSPTGAVSVVAKGPRPPIHIPTSKPNLYLRTARPGTIDARLISKFFSHEPNFKYVDRGPTPQPPPPEAYGERIPRWLEATIKDESYFMVICLRTEGDSGEVNEPREPNHGVKVERQDGEGDDGEVIDFGGINVLGIKSVDGKGENTRFANIGVGIHEPYHRRGYAKAALEATIEASFGLWGVDVVIIDTVPGNVPLRNLVRKIGLGEGKEIERETEGETEGEAERDIVWEFGRAEWADRGRS